MNLETLRIIFTTALLFFLNPLQVLVWKHVPERINIQIMYVLDVQILQGEAILV